jgi:hypothetical protein
MTYAPKPLGTLSPIASLLMKSRAARIYAARSREIVAQIAALPVRERIEWSEQSEWEKEVARQLEEASASDQAEAPALVRCLPTAEAQPYLEHKCPAIRVAAFEAVCAVKAREAQFASPTPEAT